MTKRKIFFRADAGVRIGYGHFIRTLALADMLRDDFDCTFFTQSPSEYQQRETEKVCSLVALPSDNSKFEKFLDCLKGEEIVVLDNYFYTSEYQKQIKEKGCKLVCIDDMHDKHYYADVVINHGLTDGRLFDVEPYTRLCLGLDYALLRKPFIQASSTAKNPNSWFISFGGTDYFNLTEKALQAIHDVPCVESITVVIGDAYKYKDNLKKYPKATIMKNLTAEKMADVMRKSQYAILPSSSVCIEALACRCKVASGYFVENQIQFASILGIQRYVLPLGELNKISYNGIVDNINDYDFVNISSFTKIPQRYFNTFKTFLK